MPLTTDCPDENVRNLRGVDCDTPHDKDKSRWCMRFHIAWEGDVLALYKVLIALQLYH